MGCLARLAASEAGTCHEPLVEWNRNCRQAFQGCAVETFGQPAAPANELQRMADGAGCDPWQQLWPFTPTPMMRC